MRPAQLRKLLVKSVASGLPVLVKGAPGIGKTDIIKAVAAETGAILIIMHPVVSDPTDFKGMPCTIVKDGITTAEFLPFGDLVKLMTATALTICFFDDLGQAEPAVQKALMQLLLAREINGKKISDSVVFIAATNRKEDKAGVSGMLEPVKSRFSTIVELTVSPEDWTQWAVVAGLPVSLIAFIKFRPALLHEFKASSDLVNSPCPRTVANLGKLIALDLPNELKYEAYSGSVGNGFAAEYLAFEPIMLKLPKVDNILNGNDTKPPTEISVSCAVVALLSRKATENNIGVILNYIKNMDSELQCLFAKSATALNPDLTETMEMITWNAKNADLMM